MKCYKCMWYYYAEPLQYQDYEHHEVHIMLLAVFKIVQV